MNRDDELLFDLDLEPDEEEVEANYWIERLHAELENISKKGRKPRNRRRDWLENEWDRDGKMF